MRVNEIFLSIQGEGLDAGRLCTFVRFTACNIRCGYCDTAYAFYEGGEQSIPEILEQVSAAGAPMVCLTGGEPMLQQDLPQLAQALIDGGSHVVIETGGTLPLGTLPQAVVRVMDVKTPGALRGDVPHAEFAASKRFHRTHLHHPNLDILTAEDQVKFVLCDRDDYLWALAFTLEHELHDKVRAVLFSPVHPGLSPDELAAWIAEDRPPVRLNLQLHKYIWGADVRGV